MHIWVDADACPGVIKEILFRAAIKRFIPLTLIANHALRVPPSPYIKAVTVASGFDVADDEIVKRVGAQDLVITSDIPLAAEVLAKEAHVLTSRGERLTPNNIGARLTMRDFLETMRSSGEHTAGPPPLGAADKKRFADQLDALLTRLIASRES